VAALETGDLNLSTRTLEVQQRHAHAWVEAFVDGKWATFDATPAAARTESVTSNGPRFAGLANAMNRLEYIWGEYVVRMSLERQRAAFGRPLRDAWESLRNGAFLWAIDPNGDGIQVDARSGAAVTVVLLLLAAAVWTTRGLFARTWHRRKERRAQKVAVRFWRRFVRLAGKRGVKRGVAETPAEFAARATASWNGTLSKDLAALPASAAQDFYAVRFGGVRLPAERVAALSAALDRLEERFAR
ncbi:MAG: DUF4129 domain-containing protein, partial [Planctomycetota bacterium]